MSNIYNIFIPEVHTENQEIFTTLFKNDSCRVESICSWMSTPGSHYNQHEDEWVLLIRGEAVLEIEEIPYSLRAGDSLFIPKHTKHQVLSTSKNAYWIGIFSS